MAVSIAIAGITSGNVQLRRIFNTGCEALESVFDLTLGTKMLLVSKFLLLRLIQEWKLETFYDFVENSASLLVRN
jgi:hypothetical protein